MYIFDKEKRNWTERGVTDIILEVTTKGNKTKAIKHGDDPRRATKHEVLNRSRSVAPE